MEELFYSLLFIYKNQTVIVDNTNCKMKYLQAIEEIVPDMQIKVFDVPLWKLLLRNFWRSRQGKWIRIKDLYNMHRNFNKMKKEMYAKYMVHQ